MQLSEEKTAVVVPASRHWTCHSLYPLAITTLSYGRDGFCLYASCDHEIAIA